MSQSYNHFKSNPSEQPEPVNGVREARYRHHPETAAVPPGLSEPDTPARLLDLSEAFLPQRLLILSSETGGGHRSAAAALKHAFLDAAEPDAELAIHIENVLEECSVIHRQLSNLYNHLLRHGQQFMRVYYYLINGLNLHRNPFLIHPLKGYALKLLETHQPQCIISVHPMLQYFAIWMSELAEAEGYGSIPVYSVVTDPCYGFWKGWAHPKITQYYTATPRATRQLEDYGVNRKNIVCMGLPTACRYDHLSASEKESAKQAVFGARAHRLTLLFNAGWHGCQRTERLLFQLLKSLSAEEREGLNIVFQAGKNMRQFEKLKRYAHAHPELSLLVLNAENEMQEVYAISDVMMSKSGALTVFEALRLGIPLMIDTTTPPMPQEAGTASYIEKIRAGLRIQNIWQLKAHLLSMIENPALVLRFRLNALEHAEPQAALNIARNILSSSARARLRMQS